MEMPVQGGQQTLRDQISSLPRLDEPPRSSQPARLSVSPMGIIHFHFLALREQHTKRHHACERPEQISLRSNYDLNDFFYWSLILSAVDRTAPRLIIY
jgi:hypothetical protein